MTLAWWSGTWTVFHAGLVCFGAGLPPIKDLPLIRTDVSTYQVSSHDRKGFNQDGGWYLYSQPTGTKQLDRWESLNKGATCAYTETRAHTGHAALVHTVSLVGDPTGTRAIRKHLPPGFFENASELSFWIWPEHADGGMDYSLRVGRNKDQTSLPIEDLQPRRWNHVVLDLTNVPCKDVMHLDFVFSTEFGAQDGMRFFIDDIALVRDGEPIVIDDFETGPRRAVLFDAVGPGCIRNIWGLGGGDLRIEADGREVVNARQTDLFEGRIPGFPRPFVFREMLATGPWHCTAHGSFVPIYFAESCRVTTSHADPFYHIIAERYRVPEQAVRPPRGQDLARLKHWWDSCGQDPKGWADLKTAEVEKRIEPGQPVELFHIHGQGAIASIRMQLSSHSDEVLQKLRLRIYWDGETVPSVDAPVGHFFGAGVEWRDVPSLMIGIQGDTGYCYFPMPFWKSARIILESFAREPVEQARCRVTWRTVPYPQANTGYFRTWFNRGRTEVGKDWLFLHAVGRGHYVGVVHTLVGGAYCEGDIRFYLDGSRSPAFYGTGTEDYYLAACWPNKDHHTPLHGCVGDVAQKAAQARATRQDKTIYDFPACYYRFHLEAPVRFLNGARLGIEHGRSNSTHSIYSSLAYYYSQDVVGLIETDRCNIGEPVSERVHRLECGPGIQRFTGEGFFEGDHDKVPYTFSGLATIEPLMVTLKADPTNKGIRLRRVYDQTRGRQKAKVFVNGMPAGVWYNPGQNRFKRWAESDFEIPPDVVREAHELNIRFEPEGAVPWTICELRALCHMQGDRLLTTERRVLTPFVP